MTLETVVNELTTTVETLVASVQDKRTVLGNAAVQSAGSLATAQSHLTTAKTKVTEAAASATAAANALAQVTAYKTAATALNTATTATQAVTNLLPDMLAKKDPARHPFRKKMPTLVLDFERQRCHRYSPETGYGETPLNTFMTFTRASTATYTGPDGLIKTAAVNEPRYDYDPITGECKGILIEDQRTNLFTYSAYPAYPASASAYQWWNRLQCDVYPNVAVAPDGTMTAAKAVVSVGAATTGNDGVGVFAVPSVTSSDTHTLTLYVKDAGAGYLRIRESINTGQIAKVNLTTGAITAEAGYTTTTFTVATTNVGNGWWRVAAVRTPTTKFGFNLKPGIDVGDGVSGIYVWGAQLEAGAFPTSYIPTPATFTGRASTATYLDSNGVLQTAASGVARSNAYDYDSDGVLRPIGLLLLEGSATNLGRYSEQFESVAWNKYYSTVTANATTAPDGNVTADYVIPGTVGNSAHGVSLQATPISASTIYTKSVYLKAGGYTFGYISIVDTTNASGAYFDLSTGVVRSTEGNAIIGATIKKAANGFYRCTVTYTSGAFATTTNSFVAACAANGSVVFAGDGISGIYIWGAQLETGSYATSYIPTAGSQVTRAADTSTSAQATRAADDAKVDGTKFSDFYNQLAGTAVTEFSAGILGGAGYPGAFSVSDGGLNNRFGGCIEDVNVDKVQTNIRVNGTYATSVYSDKAVTVGQAAKIGVRISRAGWSGAVSGGSTVGTGAAVMPQTMSILKVGVFDTPLNGPVKRITYYPQPFTNEELQTFTAP